MSSISIEEILSITRNCIHAFFRSKIKDNIDFEKIFVNKNINIESEKTSSDLMAYISVMTNNQDIMRHFFKEYNVINNSLFYIRFIRNKWAHQYSLSKRETYKLLDEICLILEEICNNSEEYKFLEFQRLLILRELSGEMSDYLIKHSDDIVNWKLNFLSQELEQKNLKIKVMENLINELNGKIEMVNNTNCINNINSNSISQQKISSNRHVSIQDRTDEYRTDTIYNNSYKNVDEKFTSKEEKQYNEFYQKMDVEYFNNDESNQNFDFYGKNKNKNINSVSNNNINEFQSNNKNNDLQDSDVTMEGDYIDKLKEKIKNDKMSFIIDEL